MIFLFFPARKRASFSSIFLLFSLSGLFCFMRLIFTIFFNKKFLFFKNSAIFGILAFIVGASYFYLNLHSLISPKTILFFDVAVFLLFLFLRSVIAAKIADASQFRKMRR